MNSLHNNCSSHFSPIINQKTPLIVSNTSSTSIRIDSSSIDKQPSTCSERTKSLIIRCWQAFLRGLASCRDALIACFCGTSTPPQTKEPSSNASSTKKSTTSSIKSISEMSSESEAVFEESISEISQNFTVETSQSYRIEIIEDRIQSPSTTSESEEPSLCSKDSVFNPFEDLPEEAISEIPVPPSSQKQISEFLNYFSIYFEYLRRLPKELRPLFIKQCEKAIPSPPGTQWASLAALDATQHPDTPSLPLSHVHLLYQEDGPLRSLNQFLNVSDFKTHERLEQLRKACEQAEQPTIPFERSSAHDLLLMLPYAGALQFITHTEWYLQRYHLMKEKGEIPPELRLIQEWASLRLWREIVPLSFTRVIRRFNRFIDYLDPIPSYLLPLLPFEPNTASWEAGLANSQQVNKALKIAKELGKVDLCLRLPADIVDPCLQKGSLLAQLVHTYRQLPPIPEKSTSHHYPKEKTTEALSESKEPGWLKAHFPKIPSFLLPIVLQGYSLSEVLENPNLWPVTLALLRQVKFLELLTLLPIECSAEFSENHSFFPGMPWAEVLEKSRTALLAEGKQPLTETLAKELLYFDPNASFNTESIVRLSLAPNQILQHARYLSHRMAQETVETLETLHQQHDYLPLSPGEMELVQEVFDLIIDMDGFITTGWRAIKIGQKVKNYLQQNQFLVNRNLFAWAHGSLEQLEKYSPLDRQKVYLNIHKVYVGALNKLRLLPFSGKLVAEIQEDSPKRETIAKNVHTISESLLHLVSSFPQIKATDGKITLQSALDWFEKDNEQHEPFFGTKSVYGYRSLKTAIFENINKDLSLDQLISFDLDTEKHLYHLPPLVNFLSHAALSLLEQHLGIHHALYPKEHFQALPSLLAHLYDSFPATKALLERQEELTQEEFVNAAVGISTESIDYLTRLLTASKTLQPHQIKGIASRQRQIEILKAQKLRKFREFRQKIEEAEKKLSENSSFNPFATLTAQQQRLHQEARAEKIKLVAERQILLEQTKIAKSCLKMQIEIIQHHGIPEILDMTAWYLGLPMQPPEM